MCAIYMTIRDVADVVLFLLLPNGQPGSANQQLRISNSSVGL